MVAVASWLGALVLTVVAMAGPILSASRQRRRRLAAIPPRPSALRLPWALSLPSAWTRPRPAWLLAASVGVGLWLMAQGLPLTGAAWLGVMTGLPHLARHLRRRQARSALERDLPAVVDLLGQGLAAGGSLEVAMETLVESFPGPMAGRLRSYLGRRRLGDSRQEALASLLTAEDSDDWRFVVGGLIDAEELGVPVSRVLAEQAAGLQQRRLAGIKAQAARVGPQIALVTVFLSAPSALLLLAGTAVLGSLGRVQGIEGLIP